MASSLTASASSPPGLGLEDIETARRRIDGIIKPTPLTNSATLEQMLESAIVACWEDLTNGTEPVLIHLEYNLTASGTVDDLRFWSSMARGHWLLVCKYRMSGSNSHSSGLRFDNGYHSEGLAHTLEFVMQHQNAFALPPNLGRPGLLQIPRPAEAEIGAAQTSVREAFDLLSSALV